MSFHRRHNYPEAWTTRLSISLLLVFGGTASSAFLPVAITSSGSCRRAPFGSQTSALFASPPRGRRDSRYNNVGSKSPQNSRRRTNDSHNTNQYNDNDDVDDSFVSREFDDYDDDFDYNYFEDDENYDENEPPLFDIDSTDTKAGNGAHFFSRKPLEDPSFVLEDTDHHAVFDQLCRGGGISQPSRIQSMAWPVILQGKHTIVADQTGSGKTLAYLIPLLQKALSSPENNNNNNNNNHNSDPHNTAPKLTGAPQLLILAPTAELADQVRTVCDRLATDVSFSTMVVTATGKYSTSIRDQIRMLQRQPVDVLISTPGRLSTIVRTKHSGLDLSSRLQAMVLDEVDILMDDTNNNNNNNNNDYGGVAENETFGPQLRTIGEAVGTRLEQTQFVFVTATLPDRIVNTVTREFPGVVQVRGPGLHRVAPSMTERLIDVSVPSRDNRNSKLGLQVKAKQLLKTLRMTRCRRTLIFCNTVQSCRAVENLLRRSDKKRQIYDVRAYHNAMTPEARNANLEVFSRAGQDRVDNSGRKRNAVDYILVCTDRAGRGVDFGAAPVDHVVLFDFPRDPAEYVRRVGRTARAGRTGTCTVFAYGWQLPIARSVMGKTAETLRVAGGDDYNDDEEDESDPQELRGGVQGRQRHKKNQRQGKISESKTRDTAVKNNIEGDNPWKRSKGGY